MYKKWKVYELHEVKWMGYIYNYLLDISYTNNRKLEL
jgi:hypothetical protein